MKINFDLNPLIPNTPRINNLVDTLIKSLGTTDAENNPLLRLKVLHGFQQIETELNAALYLIQEVVYSHSYKDTCDYNECDTAPCDWCMKAKKLIELNELAQQNKLEENKE